LERGEQERLQKRQCSAAAVAARRRRDLSEAEEAGRRRRRCRRRPSAMAAAAASRAEDEAKAEPPFDPEKHRLEKLAGLPEEPPAGEADLVACVVRTGTGRLARRFRRSDRLQVLFDFVEAGGAPAGRYRLVTQFPRRALEVEAAAGQTFVEA
ncbi:unnamed protein product, partial [Phaeothamnion confervicola]